MDNELKTVGGVEPENTDLSLSVDPILREQKLQIDQMRSIYVNFNKGEPNAAKRAMQNLTVLRIYHQMGRIIKFTEAMDALEDKLYDSMLMNIGQMDSADPATLMMLLKVQAQLQETMVQSQLLIKPYLDMDIEAIAPPQEFEESFGATIISQESRNNIRTGAQALLTELRKANPELIPADTSKDNNAKAPKKRGRKPKSTNTEDTDVRSASAE